MARARSFGILVFATVVAVLAGILPSTPLRASDPDGEERSSLTATAGAILIVDDFADAHPGNLLSQWSGTFASQSGALVSASVDGGTLTLSWSVSSIGSFIGYVTEIKGASSAYYNAVSLKVKGGVGGERVRLGVRDSLGNESKVPLGEFLPAGITTGFQEVIVPIGMLTSLARNVGLESISLTVEYTLSPEQGSIVIDDLRLENRTGLDLPVDQFEQAVLENAVSGGYWMMMEGGSILSMAPLQSDRGNVLRLSLSGSSPKGWAMMVTDLRSLNVSSMTAVSFWIRSFGQMNRPNLYLVTRNGGAEVRKFVDIERYGIVGPGWNRISVPLSAFLEQGLDLSRVVELRFAFEGETLDGTIDLDDIRFVSKYSAQTFLPSVRKR